MHGRSVQSFNVHCMSSLSLLISCQSATILISHSAVRKYSFSLQMSVQVIAALIRGDHSSALLSESALDSALDILSSYLPADCNVDEEARNIDLEFSALFALDAVLFSRPILLDDNQLVLRPAAVRALVAVFEIAWVFGSPESHEGD